MSGTVWSKFYWSDWDTDPALRLCSFAAQGFWMRLLCIAAAHDPIGYVAVAGRALDETSLARMTGGQESEVRSLLGELEQNGVCSRDRHRRIYSRRMVSDARKAATAKKNGKLGGNPRLGNNTVNPALDNPPDNGGLKPQGPEATNHKITDASASVPNAPDPRGCRLPEDWQRPPTECPVGMDLAALEREANRFRNYWRSVAGARGRKINWDSAWRYWISKAEEDQRGKSARKPAKQSSYLDTLSDIDRAMEQARVNVEQRDRDTRDSFGPAAVG